MAADFLERILKADEEQQNGITIKNLILNSNKCHHKKEITALLCQTLKYLPVLKEILNKYHGNFNISIYMTYILIYEMLFGKGIRDKGYEEIFVNEKNALIQILNELKENNKYEELLKLTKSLDNKNEWIKCARVNILLTTIKDIVHILKKDYKIKQHKYIEDVIIFKSIDETKTLYNHSLVRNGLLVLQGFGSCLVGHTLNPEENSIVLDACAAPGNKTIHISALMQNHGKIIALDKCKRRIKILKANIKKHGCKNIHIKNEDFLLINPLDEEYRDVEYILLDPSCSGSGTSISRLDHLLPSNYDKRINKKILERLEKLSKFQCMILKHAFKFKQVKVIVYSTCSIYNEENEMVINEVLPIAHQNHYQLTYVFPQWKRRGNNIIEEYEKLLRIDPIEDKMDGFFIAKFEKHN